MVETLIAIDDGGPIAKSEASTLADGAKWAYRNADRLIGHGYVFEENIKGRLHIELTRLGALIVEAIYEQDDETGSSSAIVDGTGRRRKDTAALSMFE